MSVQIIINGENAKESLLELSTLAAGIGASAPQAPAQAPLQQPPYEQQAFVQAPVQQEVPSQPQFQQAPVQPQTAVPTQAPSQQPAPSAVPTSSAPSFTVEQLGVAAGPLVDAGRGPDLTNWISQRGAATLTQLDKAYYGEFALFLRSLGAKI